MELDNHKTKVEFYIHKSNKELFAYFPKEKEYTKESANRLSKSQEAIKNLLDLRLCYSHLGQHSSCCTDYVKESKKATENEYKELFNELTQIGYNLKVI